MSVTKLVAAFCLCSTLMVCGSGCQMIDAARIAKIPEATPEHPVVEIIGVWQPGEGTGPDGLPCRGFAGQLLFFAMGQTSPVRIKGKVRIYVFDDQGTPDEQQEPIHEFDFDGESFQAFLTQTNLGAAYQLFIPYTRKGTHNAACTLRVRLSPDEGGVVYSKMASVILPGTSKRKPEQSVEETLASRQSPQKVVSSLLQTAAQEPATKTNSGVTHADAQTTTADADSEDSKRRLRSTLTAISTVTPAATAPSAGRAELPDRALTEEASTASHPLRLTPAPTLPAQSTGPVETRAPAPAAAAESVPAESTQTPTSNAFHHPLADD